MIVQMQLQKLVIKDVRNLADIQLDCHQNTNIIVGRNAAGKTAILESIYLLSRAASFRTPRLTDIIQHGRQGFYVSASLQINNIEHLADIKKSDHGTQLKFNGVKVSKRSEQAQNIPVMTYTAETNRLLYDMPRERRHWLDWSMFHVEPEYMDTWRTYHHALRQRNALLRSDIKNDELYQPWEQVMARTAHWLTDARNKYLARINKEAVGQIKRMLGECTIELSEKSGNSEDIRTRLEQQRQRDRRIGHTRDGPHRHDVWFRLNGFPAGKTLSRGEGKQFLLYLIIAQVREFVQNRKHYPVVLIDDLNAELDREVCDNVFSMLIRETKQLFITGTNDDFQLNKGSFKRFHVEHGKLLKLIE